MSPAPNHDNFSAGVPARLSAWSSNEGGKIEKTQIITFTRMHASPNHENVSAGVPPTPSAWSTDERVETNENPNFNCCSMSPAPTHDKVSGSVPPRSSAWSSDKGRKVEENTNHTWYPRESHLTLTMLPAVYPEDLQRGLKMKAGRWKKIQN